MSVCPGCGLLLPAYDGPTHASIGASPACWAVYGRVLERAYGDPVCRDVLQLVVDAYACQHPGVPGRREAQSVGIHLMTLLLVLEDREDPREGPHLHRRMVARPRFTWLEPPAARGRVTVADIDAAPTPAAYVDAVWGWARDVWTAWRLHHDTVRSLLPGSLATGP